MLITCTEKVRLDIMTSFPINRIEVIYQDISGYPNTEKRVENTTRSGVFFTEFEVFRYPDDETLSRVFGISSQLKQKPRN